jgi:hypothetical protein
MMKYLFLFFMVLIALASNSQTAPFEISVQPVDIPGFTGLQSYAFAKSGDLVLFIGGRTDGLHKRQPFAAFNKQYNNTEAIVLDLSTATVKKRSLKELPQRIFDQLQSTNMEFRQQGNDLILIGGYGYSEAGQRFMTYPSVIRIAVPAFIDAILHEKPLPPTVEFLEDERMAVTGGRLGMLDGTYFLVGGHRFDGRYNPHSPDHGPGYSQQYTDQIRKFRLSPRGTVLKITAYSAVTDTAALHRRDYNLVSQYDEKGRAILTLFSGVFRRDKDLPYTSMVDISGTGHRELDGFSQRYAHYHTATMPVHSRSSGAQYAIFFGGIGLYHRDSTGKDVRDDNVPFVKHISVVERSKGRVMEYLLPKDLPGYLGAGAEFIQADEKKFTGNGMLDIDKIGLGVVTVGYIVGGIESDAPNVFWSQQAASSKASAVVWRVILKKTSTKR